MKQDLIMFVGLPALVVAACLVVAFIGCQSDRGRSCEALSYMTGVFHE